MQFTEQAPKTFKFSDGYEIRTRSIARQNGSIVGCIDKVEFSNGVTRYDPCTYVNGRYAPVVIDYMLQRRTTFDLAVKVLKQQLV